MDALFFTPEDDKTTGPVQEAVSGLFLSIACVLVSLRFYVRARMIKKLWWDDFFLLLGLLGCIASLGLCYAGIRSGLGRHVYYLTLEQAVFALEMLALSVPMTLISLMFTKLSICLHLMLIFMTNRVWNYRVWKRVMCIIMALVVAIHLSSIILFFSQCQPIARLWNPTISGTCWSKERKSAIFYYQGGVSIFTDFLLALLPIYFLKDIQISIRNKLSICALMSLGIFTGICAINRTVISSVQFSNDITYTTKMLDIWAQLEMTVAMIAAAIPALRPLWATSAKSHQNQKSARSDQNQKNGERAGWSDDQQHLNSPYVMMTDQRTVEAGSLPSRIEHPHQTAQRPENQGGR